ALEIVIALLLGLPLGPAAIAFVRQGGLWRRDTIEQTEGAKFWLRAVNELKTRGVSDIVIAVVDGLKGFPEAITSVYPQTLEQTCIVHLIRNSLAFVSWKDRKAVLPSIKAIYRAESAEAASLRLSEFEAEWGKRYPAIGQIWRSAWEHLVPFFAFAPGIRKMIDTTNTVAALHRSLRKIIVHWRRRPGGLRAEEKLSR
ncbi:transposase-like protein, partial [Bradyrhizobium sp. cir1]|nr:transposase-like protein [Bradyrhizobium sp. cir1]